MWRSLVAYTLGVGVAAGSNPVIPIFLISRGEIQMDYKKAQITAIVMFASAILSGTGIIALAIRPDEAGFVIPVLLGGIPFVSGLISLYRELYSSKNK